MSDREGPEEGINALDRIAELAKQLPEDVVADLPTDGATQHDHYLYGAPKKMTIIDKINEAVQIEKANLDTLAKVAAEIGPEIEKLATARGLVVAVFASGETIDFVMQPQGTMKRLTIHVNDDGTMYATKTDNHGSTGSGVERGNLYAPFAWVAEVPHA